MAVKRVGIIMAGGSGERFWPLSRRVRPKQLLKLASEEKMMIEETIERISPIIPVEDIYIITSILLQEPIRAALPALPRENVIAEPFKRNTAPCLALGAAFIKAKYEKQGFPENLITVAVLTADHVIKPADAFVNVCEAALHHVEHNTVLATIGVQPVRPETGYGYIEVAEPFNGKDEIEIKDALSFREKPDEATAQEYISEGRFLWNSGMFFYRLDVFINQLANFLPEVGDFIEPMYKKFDALQDYDLVGPFKDIQKIFYDFPDISIDYGLLEKSDKIAVVRAAFNWDDIGSWDSLDRVKEMDEQGNLIFGNGIAVNSHNSIVFNAAGQKVVVAAVDLEGIAVVVTEDAVLVCPKNKAQDVKKAVEKLKEGNMDNWL